MKLAIYAAKDELIDEYATPFAMNERAAIRNFGWMCKEKQPEDCEDKVIYKIGDYDTSTGKIFGHAPMAVYDLGQAKKRLEDSKE